MRGAIVHRQELRLRRFYLGIALLASLLTVLLWLVRGGGPLLDRIDRLILDTQIGLRGPLKPQSPVLLVTVDDETLSRLGSLAPDRARVAELIDRVGAGGPRAIALDSLYPDRARPDPRSDELLAAAMRRSGRVLLAFALPLDEQARADEHPPAWLLPHSYVRIGGDAAAARLPSLPSRAVLPIEALAQASAGLGHVTAQRAVDGALPFDLPGLALDGEVYPSLALRTAALALGVDWRDVRLNLGREVLLGDRLRVPLDRRSRQWVDYYGPAGTLETVSFIDVLDGKVPAERFAGRVVLVGTAALGAGDTVPSPFESALPGVERLGTVVDNMLSGRMLTRPPWDELAELAGMLLLPLIAVALIATQRPWVALGQLLGLLAASCVALQGLFVARLEFVSPAFPLLALALATLGALLLRNHEEQQRRAAALAALRASEQRYALALQGAKDGMWDWDLDSGEVYYSERWMQMMRLTPEQASDMAAWTLHLDAAARQQFEDALADHLAGRTLQLSHVLHFRDGGGEVWLLARGIATRDAAQRALRMAGSLTDISQERELQRQITFDALHDRLTGLPNRAAFLERLTQVFNGGAAVSAGVVLLDLDGFRAFNEGEGTTSGDAVLREVAKRLRTRDGQPLNVARLGADRFGLLFTGALGASGIDETRLAHWALAQLRHPLQLDGRAVTLAASVGWAHTSHGLHDAGELMSAAEMALAQAKAHERGRVHEFDQAEQLVESSRRWLKDNIDLAMQRDEFRLFYQPLIRLEDRRLLGFEALLRWPHPTRGMVMPGDFIPFAEESGQIVELGRWTLLEAARQLVAWSALGFDGEIAVNLSGMQFSEGDLDADARAVLAVLAEAAIEPRRIKLEVTESMAMANPQRTAEALQQLAALGFKISIDDFGTGYSSLAYLHRFPFDTLKIDRSFVMRLASGREAVEIVRTIVGLALALDKQVLAEGVEDEAQAALLQQLGVHIGQGWLFAKALPAAQAQALFSTPS